MTSQPTETTVVGEAPDWMSLIEGMKHKRREMKPLADRQDPAIRSVLLNLQAMLRLPGSVEPATVDELCGLVDGLPRSYLDYTNQRRTYDYWSNTAVWTLTHSLPGALYSVAGAANRSFNVTVYARIAMVMDTIEQPYINVHVYPVARLSLPNRARLAELLQRDTKLPVLKCTQGDGCV